MERKSRGKTVVVATTKGGSGKTTLCACLTAFWISAGWRVALVDTDPQESLANMIKTAPGLPPIWRETDHERVGELLKELRPEYDRVVVDTAGFRNRTALYAMVSGDLVLIPCRTAKLDIDQLLNTYELVRAIERTPEREGRRLGMRAIITQANPRSTVALWTRQALSEADVPVADTEITHRTIYQEVSFTGDPRALLATNSPAAGEIYRIGQEVENCLEATNPEPIALPEAIDDTEPAMLPEAIDDPESVTTRGDLVEPIAEPVPSGRES